MVIEDHFTAICETLLECGYDHRIGFVKGGILGFGFVHYCKKCKQIASKKEAVVHKKNCPVKISQDWLEGKFG